MIRHSIPFILLFCSLTISAQRPVQDGTENGSGLFGKIEKYQVESLFELYSLKIDPASEIINGREYFPYYFRSNLKPILFVDKKHSSSITLNGRKFDDIDIDYDTYMDQVVYIDSVRFFIYSPLRLALNKDNIDCFELRFEKDTLSFAYLCKNEDPGFNLQEGFYEVVFDGDSKYIIKHKSIIQGRNGYDDYLYKPAGYVNTGSGFFRITNNKDFISLFGERSEEVKSFIRDSGIKIRKANKEQIKYVLEYFDGLKSVAR